MKDIKRFLVSLVLISTISIPSNAQIDVSKQTRKEILDSVFAAIARDGNEEIDLDECFSEILKRGIGACDKYAEVYITKNDQENFKSGQRNQTFFGIGVEIISKDGKIVFIPQDSSPALNAGIQVGDILLRVDSLSIDDISINEVRDLIKGQDGTEVEITVLQNGKVVGPLKIKRRKITVRSITSGMIDSVTGFIKIRGFNDDLFVDLYNSLQDLDRAGMKGLIFDLRNNPGGSLQGVLSSFRAYFAKNSDDTLISLLKQKDTILYESIIARQKGSYRSLPIVVLTNKFSASASEIFAGLLQEFNDAKIVGDTTFGKGVAQSVYVNKRTSTGLTFSFKITTFEYRLGNSRRRINKIGIFPDYFVHDPIVVESSILTPSNRINFNPSFDGQAKKAVEVLKEMMEKRGIR